MSNVASLENSKRLSELSGWVCDEFIHTNDGLVALTRFPENQLPHPLDSKNPVSA